MTKDEAKTKWCPQARVVYIPKSNTYTTNRIFNSTHYPKATCLADECACWVWRLKRNVDDPSTWEGQCGLIK